jgi:ubiquinol-cytochrome c reductase cytochrome c1 subunit
MNYVYDGKADIAGAEADKVEAKKEFWGSVNKIAALSGNAEAGAAGYAMCQGCHMEGAVNMGGAIPPALDHAGSLYDKSYLIALIKDPAMAMNTDHKFADTMMHPMGSIKSMITEDQAIADTVAYLMANNAAEVTPKEAFMEACGRCHESRYAGLTQLGETPKFKYEKDALAYKVKVLEEQDLVKAYMGKLPPDLSMMAKSRSHHFLETFIENPQSQLAGTSMPRVGLTKEGVEKVLSYMVSVGDKNKPARDALGWKVILFFVIFTILAYLWKQSVWSKLH